MGNWYNKSIKQRNYLKAQERMNKMCEYLYAYDNRLNETPGIYILTRTNPPTKNGEIKKYVYVGQAIKVVERLAQHMIQFSQRIDISLKSRGLWYKSNPYGWKIDVYYCNADELNEKEREFIKAAQEQGYELYNITSGGQDEGKEDINERAACKGYRDGLKQGYANAIKDINEFFDKYFSFTLKGNYTKKNGEVKEIWLRKAQELKELLENGKRTEDNNTVDQESN